MITEEWKQILEKQDVRRNLSELRRQIKEPENRKRLAALICGQEDCLISLLDAEDAKTRKNAALLMGDLKNQVFLLPVFEAYLKEPQRFIRSSYIDAIGNFAYTECIPKLKERLETLAAEEVTIENEKHLTEEMRAISALLVQAEGIRRHHFTGLNRPHDIILLTNRNFPDYTAAELMETEPGAKIKPFGAGVRARVENLHWHDAIRTYQELLFVVKGMESAPMDAAAIAEKIVQSDLLSWLTDNHDEGAPFFFRLELKSRKPLSEKSAFVKKLSGHIERLSERALRNSTANYEIEFRLIENKEGGCNLLVKLFTIKDQRFAYRKEVVPTSIRPVNAALASALAKKYMRENAQILDPFCGVGTMLIERCKAVRSATAYGVDIQEDAILKARRNAEAAGQVIHFINRDFFRFEHAYLFDEVITDMPFQIGKITEEEVRETYSRFFGTIEKYLKPDAVMILYSHNKDLTEKLAFRNGFVAAETFEISKKEGTYVFVLQRRKR